MTAGLDAATPLSHARVTSSRAGGLRVGAPATRDEERSLALEVIAAREALDRLSTIVDEAIAMQPVLGWEELLTLVEKELFASRMAANEDLRVAKVTP